MSVHPHHIHMNAEELAMSLHSNVSEFRRGAQVRTVFRMSAKVPNSDNHTSCESTEPNRSNILENEISEFKTDTQYFH